MYDSLLKRDGRKNYSSLIQRVLNDQFMTIYKKSDNKVREKLEALHRSCDNDKIINLALFNKIKLTMREIDNDPSSDSVSDSNSDSDKDDTDQIRTPLPTKKLQM